MNYSNLKFNQSFRQRFFNRTTWVIALILGLLLGWNLIGHNLLIWILIPVFAGFGWVASFGWRSAIKVISRYIRHLEKL